MRSFLSRICQPVKREGAERYLRITLLSFAASVILTRLLLELTGYPQLGDGTLHIAHVLWGGLLLFIAALLPLLIANRSVYSAGGLLSGVGVGLFIDEVGKFITQTNDYFYPPAAPIIYACFLLTVLLYLQVRRPPTRNSRAELYRALDALAEVLDHDLDAVERGELETRLQRVVQQTTEPELARLAEALLAFLVSDATQVIPEVPGFRERSRQRATTFATRWINRRQLKLVLAVGFVIAGIPGLIGLLLLLVLMFGPGVSAGELAGRTSRVGLEGLASLPLLVAAGCLILGRERRGIVIGRFGLLFSLTIVNLLVFYFDQFHALSATLFQFVLLLGALHYRRRYLAA
jgi:hypothetical protein